MRRHLQVKLVKDSKNPTSEASPEEEMIIKFAYANKMAHDLAGQIAKAVVSYVAIDTLRQVIIARATKK